MTMRSLIILAIFFSAIQVEAKEYFGSWTFDPQVASDQFSMAFTKNKSGSEIGFICNRSDQKCFYYLLPSGETCAIGSEQVLLMSTNQGGQAINTTCLKLAEMYLLVFKNFDQMTNAYKESKHVGFAAAMKSGGFKSFKFSLNGSSKAIKKAANSATQQVQPAGSKDMYF